MTEAEDLPLIQEEVAFTDLGFNLQDHQWTQRGTMLECDGRCPFGHVHGHIISAAKTITRDDKGVYKLKSLL